MYTWQSTLRNLWYQYSAVTAVELRVLLQTTLLRGWKATHVCIDSLMPVLVLIAFLCFVRDIETGPMVATAALMLLVSRPSVGLKNMRNVVCSEKTVIMLAWGMSIAYAWDTLVNLSDILVRDVSFMRIWGIPILSWMSTGFLLIPCGIVPFSPFFLVIGLWLLDTEPSLSGYGRALCEACAAVVRSFLFFAVVYLVLVLPIVTLLIELMQYLLPLQLSRCCAALMIAPWYGAVIGSWYIYMRYR